MESRCVQWVDNSFQKDAADSIERITIRLDILGFEQTEGKEDKVCFRYVECLPNLA